MTAPHWIGKEFETEILPMFDKAARRLGFKDFTDFRKQMESDVVDVEVKTEHGE